MLRHWSFWKKC